MRLGLTGDGQADLTVHGGEHQALYSYPLEHYGYWQNRLHIPQLAPGTFGENFTTSGLLENVTCVGDILSIGKELVQVTMPRIHHFEFRRQLTYKAEQRGGQVVIADRWFPSSKTCSCCSYKLTELSLSARSCECPVCHTQHDRDVNAAMNLKDMAVSSTVTACGEEGAGLTHSRKVKPASVKQEFNGEVCL